MPSITINQKEIPLRLTMRRVRLFKEHVGVDLLNAKGKDIQKALTTPEGITGALYALAGGRKATGVDFEDFEDAIDIHDLPTIAEQLQLVFQRDTPEEGDEGNAKSGE